MLQLPRIPNRIFQGIKSRAIILINILLSIKYSDIEKLYVSVGPHRAILILNVKMQASLIDICIFLQLAPLQKWLSTEKCQE